MKKITNDDVCPKCNQYPYSDTDKHCPVCFDVIVDNTNEKENEMIKGISKPKDDYAVCDKCGDENIVEEAWIYVNDCITIKGKSYYRFSEEIKGDTEAICYFCFDVCNPIHIKEYRRKEKK